MKTTDRRTPPARTEHLRSRYLVLALVAGVAALVLPESSSEAADPKRSRAKMVELNSEALLSYEAKDWETAKDLLNQAIAEAKTAGLENNNMTARTYVHLGAVFWTGYHDRATATHCFSLAKQIRPDIMMTPRIETAELDAVFAAAADHVETTGPVDLGETTPTPAVPVAPSRPSTPSNDGSGEPDLPETMSAPLMCTIPDIVPAGRALTMRCALRPEITAQVVQIHLRPRGVETYQTLDMQRTPKGWYLVTLGRERMNEGVLQIYFDARDSTGNQVATLGQIDNPSVLMIGRPSSFSEKDDDPMRRLREQARAERYEAGLHRRRAKSFWIGMGAGMGWGHVPAGSLEWEHRVRVSAITTRAGLLHLIPELGLMLSDNFGLALQGRIEYIQQEQAVYLDPTTGEPVQLAANLSGSPATLATALLARAIGYTDLSSSGNLRFSYSGDAGYGFVRFPVRPSASVDRNENGEPVVDYSRTIAKTDTRPIGAFLVGASVGVVWNLSRHFALSLNTRALTGLPNWGALIEGTLSAQLAFGGTPESAQAAAEDEEQDERGAPDEDSGGESNDNDDFDSP